MPQVLHGSDGRKVGKNSVSARLYFEPSDISREVETVNLVPDPEAWNIAERHRNLTFASFERVSEPHASDGCIFGSDRKLSRCENPLL